MTTSRPGAGKSQRVRRRLLLPAAAVAICLGAIAVIRAVQLRSAQETLLKADALRAATTSAQSLDATIAGTQALLLSISELVDLQTPPARTDSILRRIRAAAPIPYQHLVLFSPDGGIIASGREGTNQVNTAAIAATPLFRRALTSKEFGVGSIAEAAVRPGLPSLLPFALPVIDRRTGAVSAVIAATVLADSLDAVRAVRLLPVGSVLTIMDTSGTVIFRTLDPEHWIGRRFANDTGMVNDIRLKQRVGAGNRSADGTMRLVAVQTMDRVPWIVYVGLPLQVTLDPARNQFLLDLAVGALLTLLILGIGYWSTIRVVEPIESLTRDARAIADGDMSRRSTVNSGDEVGDLARAFNRMADTIDVRDAELRNSQEQLLHAQKMDALGQLAGGMAHDFNNALHVILAHAELAAAALPGDATAREDLDGIVDAAQRAAALTRQILVFSRKQVIEPQVLDLNEVVAGIERMLLRILGEQRTLHLRLSATPVHVLIDQGELEQVIVNLLTNARDASPDGGDVTVSTQLAPDAPGTGFAELAVTDTGVGMAPELREKIFDPFFTTKDRGRGTGLGLAIAYGIVKHAGGAITVASAPGAGSTFTVRLPIVNAAAAPAPGAVSSATVESHAGRVLLVDDDDAVRSSTEAMLERAGHQVVAASDGLAALAALRDAALPFDLLLTDLIMPGMSGIALANEAKRLHPSLPVLCMSGYADVDQFRAALDENAVSCIMKPFSSAQLADAMQRSRTDELSATTHS